MSVQPTAATAAFPVTQGPPRQDAISVDVRTAQAQLAPAAAPAAAPLEALAQSEKPRRQELEDAIKRVEKFVEPMASQLQFSVDEESGTRVVKVVDRATKEVIRQIPSEEMLQIAHALDRLQGLLIKQQA